MAKNSIPRITRKPWKRLESTKVTKLAFGKKRRVIVKSMYQHFTGFKLVKKYVILFINQQNSIFKYYGNCFFFELYSSISESNKERYGS